MNTSTPWLVSLYTALLFVSPNILAEAVFAVKADIYQLENNITIDSKIERTLESKTPIHQPRLLAQLGKSALIEIGNTDQLTALEVLSTENGESFNASMKLKDRVEGEWQTITSFMPHIPNGQTVYFSRNFNDSVWLIKLKGTRYESEQLGRQSF